MVQFVRWYVILVRRPVGHPVVLRSYTRSLRILWLSVLIFAALLFSSPMALAQFSQQGPKLVGTGSSGAAGQSYSVSLSSDGNTAIVGGLADNAHIGAAWVFTRNAGVWTQQDKLVGRGATGAARQGTSVSLSSDGNTAIVGGGRQQRGHRGCMGLHAQRRRLDSARQIGRHGSDGSRQSRRLRLAVLQR